MLMSSKPTWTPIKKVLAGLDKSNLVDLLHGLFKLSDANRTFLASRFAPVAALDMMWKYRDKISQEFYPKRGHYGRGRPSVARKAILEYRRSTGDAGGTLELMVTYVEEATSFMNEVGGIEKLIDSLVSVLHEAVKLLEALEDQEEYDELLERLTTARDAAQYIGWGYGDILDEVVEGLKGRADDGLKPSVS